MFQTYKNCSIKIDGNDIITNQVDLSLQNSLQPNYNIGQRNTDSFFADNGVAGSIRLNYYLTGTDFIKRFINSDTGILSGNFGGLSFRSGYLKSYGIASVPDGQIMANVEIQFFDFLGGTFSPTYNRISQADILNFADAVITVPSTNTVGDISNVTKFNFSYSVEIKPTYLIGETLPNRVYLGKKEISAEIETDNLLPNLPITGQQVSLVVNFKHPNQPNLSESISCNGVLTKRDYNVSINDLLKSTFSVRQNNTIDLPTITSFLPTSGSFGDSVIVSGTNFATAFNLYFADMVSPAFSVLDDNTISGKIPYGAVSGKIGVENFGGIGYSATDFNVLQQQISVNSITSITGRIGDTELISGDGFYRVSRVFYSTGEATFTVISPNLIEAVVPTNASWGPVYVISDQNHLTGSSYIVGQKSGQFVPFPQIDSFSPTSGASGQAVILNGLAFSGITGMYFNNIPATFSVLSNNVISGTVPSGNVNGLISILGQSGVWTNSLNSFGGLISVTGLSKYTGQIGDYIEIYGNNFVQSLMYSPDGGNHYLASFNGASGIFGRINSTKLTGYVPLGATSGAVSIYQPDGNSLYSSNVTFGVIPGNPIVSYSIPFSGTTGFIESIVGSNFFEITGVSLVRNGVTTTISNFTGNAIGTQINFTMPPLTPGLYSVIVKNVLGNFSGVNIFKYVDAPVVSGFSLTSGKAGDTIHVSGRNFYSGTRVYLTGVEAQVDSGSYVAAENSLQFFVPSNSPAISYITLSNEVGSGTSSSQFTFLPPPFASGFTPPSGLWFSNTYISGSGLNLITDVFVGSYAASFTHLGSTGLNVTIPQYSVTDYIYLSGVNGYVSTTGKFIVNRPTPIFTSFLPPSGEPLTQVVISGNWFADVSGVTFPGAGTSQIPASFTVVDETGILATIPNGAQTGYIYIGNPLNNVQSPSGFYTIQLPSIDYISARSGYYGQTISIGGSRLDAKSFFFQGANGMLVPALSPSIFGTTGATLVVPREIDLGGIYISGSRLYGASSGTFTPLPTISGFSSTVVTGNVLAITGINAFETANVLLSGSDGNFYNIFNTVYYDFVRITGAGVINPTSGYSVISGIVNSSYLGSGKLILVSAYDTLGSLTTFTQSVSASMFGGLASSNYLTIYGGAPTISSYSPLSGNTATFVTLSGDNLDTVTGVYLKSGSNQLPISILSQSAHSLTFHPPVSGGSGFFEAVGYGAADASPYFQYIGVPAITGFSPSSQGTGQYVTILGTNLQYLTGVFFGRYQSTIWTSTLVGGNYVVNGQIPFIGEALTQIVDISVYNQAGSSSMGPLSITGSAVATGGTVTKYTSPLQTIPAPSTTGAQIALAHGLGQIPMTWQWWLVNQTAEFGYVSGEYVAVESFSTYGQQDAEFFMYSTNPPNPFVQVADSTNIKLIIASMPQIPNKTATNTVKQITSGNWKAAVVAALF